MAAVFLSSLQVHDLRPLTISSWPHNRNKSRLLMVKYCYNNKSKEAKRLEIGIGSPIIVVEAPKMLKTAASIPCLRANSGLVNPGDVGRIVSRKPKDVWAIRLTIGTYLIDGKYFKPLDLDD